MKLGLSNTVDVGRSCAVYDADGKEVKHCLFCDTKTGYVVTLSNDDQGKIIIDHTRGEVCITKEKRSAPLRVKWIRWELALT